MTRPKAFGLGVIIVAGCSRGADVQALQSPVNKHELQFSKVTMLEYERGKLVYRATADTAAGDRHRLMLSGVKAYHRGVEQTGAIELASRHASVDVQQNAVSFERGVTIKDEFGRQLSTDSAQFSGAQKDLAVPGALELSGSDVSFRASGLRGSQVDETIELVGPIEGWFKLAPKP